MVTPRWPPAPPQRRNLHTLHRPKIRGIISSGSRIRRVILKYKGRPYYATRLNGNGASTPPTPIHYNNTTAVGIANETVKKHQSRPMEMRYCYSCDQVKQRLFAGHYHPGLECLGDYPSKHHITAHHINVRPIYLHTKNSPMLLPRAPKPSDLRGCVGKWCTDTKVGAHSPFSQESDHE